MTLTHNFLMISQAVETLFLQHLNFFMPQPDPKPMSHSQLFFFASMLPLWVDWFDDEKKTFNWKFKSSKWMERVLSVNLHEWVWKKWGSTVFYVTQHNGDGWWGSNRDDRRGPHREKPNRNKFWSWFAFGAWQALNHVPSVASRSAINRLDCPRAGFSALQIINAQHPENLMPTRESDIYR